MKFAHIFNAPLLTQLSRLRWHVAKLKTQTLYRSSFRSLGAGSVIDRPTMIAHSECIDMGRNVSIRAGVRLETVPIKGKPAPELRIGDDVNIEQNVHIVCHHRVIIGPRVSVTGQCAIVDVTHPYDDVDDPTKIGLRITNDDAEVTIGEGTFIGFGAVILPNVHIGRHCVIGARAVVTSDIPDYCVAAGAPARVVKEFNQENRVWVAVHTNKESFT